MMVLAAVLVAFGMCLLADRSALSRAKDTVYLTFDDGPVRPGTSIVMRGSDNQPLDGDTPAVLAALQKHRAKATFFVVGEQARRHPRLVRREHLQGHSVQNHTDTHPRLTELTDEEIGRELKRANRAIVQAGAPKPRLFRPPYGDTDARIKRVGASIGLSQRLWTVAAGDSAESPPANVICKRVVNKAAPRAVILFHDGTGANTDEALPCVIKKLRAKGYRFGTL
jgi:peptidoglycan-N-acetylglucosamine deacetylase